MVDIRLPTFHDEGLRAALEVRHRVPGTAVLVVSQYGEPTYAEELLADRGGGIGYLLKDRVKHVADFLEAGRRVAAGGTTARDPEVVPQLLSRRRQDDPLERLTPRERKVLTLMAECRSNAGIAESRVLAVGVVEKHVQTSCPSSTPSRQPTTGACWRSWRTYSTPRTDRRRRSRQSRFRASPEGSYGVVP